MDLLVFPHQLFDNHPGFQWKPSRIVLIEESLFFGDAENFVKFHKQKLWLHRATMKRYQRRLEQLGFETVYLSYRSEPNALQAHLESLLGGSNKSKDSMLVVEPDDYLLNRRLQRYSRNSGIELKYLPNPGFLNGLGENAEYRAGKKRWFMADFYKWQRRRMNLLMEKDEPIGGKWSFDEENRKKVPKKLLPEIPELLELQFDEIDEEAREYVENRFAENLGEIETFFYPTSHSDAEAWLKHFLTHRFEKFGTYEDAIVEGESWLWHSMLTPALNVGLLTPDQVVKAAIDHFEQHDVPLNSVEGFIRQIIGWREFMRATYHDLGVEMRTTNHWGHHRKIPQSFYDGTTGIVPLDDTIQRLLKTGYCHHIERLMVLGGFMFLCEFDPDEIYRWFMELFVDSYDWVMVPNAYAMSQNADGGSITTKPYFSGSSYIRKMSHHKKGEWCDVWDGLYWRWIWNHADELAKNPRWAMMCSMVKKMDEDKRQTHLENAEAFLHQLDS
ncbi:MAG: cryptochrome/photolyase family protein [Pirellulales bacterium]